MSSIPEDHFEVYTDIYAKEGRGDELERYLRIMVRVTRSEPGVLEYAIARDDEDRNRFHVFERHTGREAFEKHMASREFADVVASGTLAQTPVLKFLKALTPLEE